MSQKKISPILLKNNSLKKTALATLLFLLLAAGFAFPIQPAKAASITILSSSGYIDDGEYTIVGEVQNLDTAPVGYVQITAKLYDSSNTIIKEEWAFSGLTIILPNQKSPFYTTLYNETQASKVDHYTLEVTSSQYTTTLPLNLKILSSDTSLDSGGWMHITGEVENAGTINATSPAVWATCYDSNGTVVYVFMDYYIPKKDLFNFLENQNQTPGQTSSFDILIDPSRVPPLKSYALTAVSSLHINSISTPIPTTSNPFDQLGETAVIAIIVATVMTGVVAILIAVLFVSRRKRNAQKQESNISEANTRSRDGDEKPSTE